MGYVLLMTLSGSALFIGYLCWEKVLGKSMTEAMKYGALIIVMLDYAVPWVWIKGIYRNVIGVFLSEDMPAGSKVLINVADIETNKAAYRTKEYQLLTFVVSIWFAVAAILLIIRIVKSLKKTHELHALAIRCEDENLERTLKHLRESIHYRRRPEIVWTRVNNETFTIGATRPIIFLQKEYAAGDLYWILKHEMTHIVRMDLWVKLLLEFVCCLHWFNPLIYLLERKIKYLSETSCDEKVINKCTEKEKRMYIDLLERNKGGNRMESPVNSALESGNRAIDRRISLMKNSRTIRPKEKVIVICIFGLLIILNSLTALAYPDVHHVKNAVTEMAEDAVDGSNFWIYDYAEDGFDMPTEAILYDEQFVDRNGQVYPTGFGEESESCSDHKVTSGVVQIHKRDNDGGCTIENYEGTRCTECGNVWRGNFLFEIEKTLCPHL